MIDIETRYGLFQTPAREGDLINRFLLRYGEWARNEVRFVAEALPEGPIRVLDAGAFVGTFGIGLSAERAVGSLCFVEANPYVAPALRENARRNAKAPFTVVEAALVPDSVPRLGAADPANLGSLSFVPETKYHDAISVEPVQFLTLSQLRREHGPFDLIKMDLEGLEHALLAEDKQVLKPGGPALWLECNPTGRSLELAELLLSAGLSVHYFAFPVFAEDNYRCSLEPIFPFAFESGLWAGRGPAPKLSDALAAQGCIFGPIFNPEGLRQLLWRTPRWGMQEWQGMSVENIVAEAAHLHQKESYTEFLRPGAPAIPEHDYEFEVLELKGLLADHDQALKQKDEEISGLTESLLLNQQVVLEKNLELEQKDEEISGLFLEISQIKQKFLEIGEELERKDQELSGQIAALSQSQRVALEKSEELRAAYIVMEDERSRAAAMADRIQAADDIKTVLETRITFGERKAAAAEQALRGLEHELRGARHELRGVEYDLHELMTQFQAIEQSTIWRSSRLLRAFLARHPQVRVSLRAVLGKAYRSLRLIIRGPAPHGG